MTEVNPKHGARYYTKADLPGGVLFPEDNTCCWYCDFYLKSTEQCRKTGETIYKPKQFIGRDCPLRNWRKEE